MVKSENEIGKVTIKNGRYKPKGIFHVPEANQPIFNEDTGKLAGVTNPRDMTYIHSYGSEAIFFESLGKGKLMATRCDNEKCENTGSIYEPFRIYCPDCLRKATPIDLTDIAKKTAKIYSFIITERTGAFNTLDIPIKFINIEFEGVCTILMSYLLVGEPEIGKRVIPIFRKNPTYTIMDLAWVLEGTLEGQLPEGFTF
jgi:uncharacterized OB-fold protein